MRRFLLMAPFLLGACSTPMTQTAASADRRAPLLAAPQPVSAVPPGPNTIFIQHSFVCQAFAQPDPRYGPLKPLGEIRMSEPGERSVSGGGFRFLIAYSYDRYETPSLRTYVYWESTGKLIEQSLLYLDRLKNPVNEFGSHGFTGLHYVYAPDSAAELQFWCSALLSRE